MPAIQIPNQRKNFIPKGVLKTEIREMLNIYLGDSTTTSKQVVVIPGWEYKISFYDGNTNKKVDCVCLVKAIFSDSICIIAKNKPNRMNCSICSNTDCDKRKDGTSATVEGPIPTCDCFISNKPNMDDYNNVTMYYVPVNNIMDISYIKRDKPKEKDRRTKVMLLGISATTLKALILHLEFFDDSAEKAIKYVDIKVGNTYNFVYECRRNGKKPTIYELEGKVVSIEECNEQKACSNKQYVREVTGENDSVYSYFSTPKDEFIKAAPVKAVKIVVDSSSIFESKLETIMLDSIRDCQLIKSDDGTIEMDPCEGCENETCDCDPSTCEYCNGEGFEGNHHPHKPKTYKYDICDDIKVEVTEDKAKIMIGCEEPKYIPIETILKFYLGDQCNCGC